MNVPTHLNHEPDFGIKFNLIIWERHNISWTLLASFQKYVIFILPV